MVIVIISNQLSFQILTLIYCSRRSVRLFCHTSVIFGNEPTVFPLSYHFT